MDIKVFDNNSVYVLRPRNSGSGELEINNTGEKYQDKNEHILHNYISDERWNQITDMIK